MIVHELTREGLLQTGHFSEDLQFISARQHTGRNWYPCDCEPKCDMRGNSPQPAKGTAGSWYAWCEQKLATAWQERPVLIGESNPYGGHPRNALLDDPPGSSGERLRRLVLGVSEEFYHERFARHNLCSGPWSLKEARWRAMYLLSLYPGKQPFVLLGKKAQTAFGLQYTPDFWKGGGYYGRAVACLPHPSGLCRKWSESGAFDRARKTLTEAGISLTL